MRGCGEGGGGGSAHVGSSAMAAMGLSGENSVRGLLGYYGRGRESQGESGDSDLGIMEICPSVRRGGDTLGDLDTHFLIKR